MRKRTILAGLIGCLLVLATGCASDGSGPKQAAQASPASAQPPTHPEPSPQPSASPRPVPSPESPAWVISADSFGPITTDMTKEQILATGAFREPPYECKYRVDWHSQTYSGKDEYGIEGRTGPILSDVHFDTQDGKLLYIYAGPSVRTDTGIREGDTVKQLRAAYSGHRVFYNDATPMKGNSEAYYGINGKKSHLIFYADKGIIEGISLEPGVFHDARYFSMEGRGLAACP